MADAFPKFLNPIYSTANQSFNDYRENYKNIDEGSLKNSATTTNTTLNSISSGIEPYKNIPDSEWRCNAKGTFNEGIEKFIALINKTKDKVTALENIAQKISEYKTKVKEAEQYLATLSSLEQTSYSDQASFDNALREQTNALTNFNAVCNELNTIINEINSLIQGS